MVFLLCISYDTFVIASRLHCMCLAGVCKLCSRQAKNQVPSLCARLRDETMQKISPTQNIDKFWGWEGLGPKRAILGHRSLFGVFQRPLTLILLQKYRDTMGAVSCYKLVVYVLLSATRRAYFCKGIAIEMGGVSRYFSKVSESGVDLILLSLVYILFFLPLYLTCAITGACLSWLGHTKRTSNAVS